MLKTIATLPGYNDGRDYLAIFDKDENFLGLLSLCQNAEIESNYLISVDEKSRLNLSFKRWIMFKEM